jgi:hypothetical protein
MWNTGERTNDAVNTEDQKVLMYCMIIKIKKNKEIDCQDDNVDVAICLK